jgi:hypothetical protein
MLFCDEFFLDSRYGLAGLNGGGAGERADTHSTCSLIICPEMNICLFESSRLHERHYSLLTRKLNGCFALQCAIKQ